MQKTLFYSLVIWVLGFSNCTGRQPEKKEYERYFLEESQSEPQSAEIPSLPQQAKGKIMRVRAVARELLKASSDPRSREIETIELRVSSGWLESVSDCFNLNLKILEPNSGITLMIIDTAVIEYVRAQCTTSNHFGSDNTSMLFLSPDSVELNATSFIIARWQNLLHENDTVCALKYIHELMHARQWKNKPQSMEVRRRESFAREIEAWQYQVDIWIQSLSREKREVLRLKKEQYSKLPIDPFVKGYIYQDQADMMTRLFGSYDGYWDMFLYYTFGPRYIQGTYVSLKK